MPTRPETENLYILNVRPSELSLSWTANTGPFPVTLTAKAIDAIAGKTRMRLIALKKTSKLRLMARLPFVLPAILLEADRKPKATTSFPISPGTSLM